MSPNLESHPTKFGDVWISADVHRESDLSVVREIIDEDCYRVQKLHAEGYQPDVILDVGCNHGIFSFVCGKLWPNARIFCFEPQLAYMRHAMHNLPDTAIPICLPVMGGNTFPELHEDQRMWLESHQFYPANMLDSFTSGEVLMKIDCEGSESNIIHTLWLSKALGQFGIITGEWHFTTAKDCVVEFLRDSHHLEINEDGDINTFFARRK